MKNHKFSNLCAGTTFKDLTYYVHKQFDMKSYQLFRILELHNFHIKSTKYSNSVKNYITKSATVIFCLTKSSESTLFFILDKISFVFLSLPCVYQKYHRWSRLFFFNSQKEDQAVDFHFHQSRQQKDITKIIFSYLFNQNLISN